MLLRSRCHAHTVFTRAACSRSVARHIPSISETSAGTERKLQGEIGLRRVAYRTHALGWLRTAHIQHQYGNATTRERENAPPNEWTARRPRRVRESRVHSCHQGDTGRPKYLTSRQFCVISGTIGVSHPEALHLAAPCLQSSLPSCRRCGMAAALESWSAIGVRPLT